VLVDFPFSVGGGAKVCLTLVVPNDQDNQRFANSIVAEVASLIHCARAIWLYRRIPLVKIGTAWTGRPTS
jgi:hypothetical protein